MSSVSVVIVNFNSKHFLSLCLSSLEKALQGIDSEVFVVDNASTDDSREFICGRYSWVNWIQNDENIGFSRANNIAISQCSKRYVLLLNPDTIVSEDCFVKTLNFMEEHPEAGALGVRMVDGKGDFLPESKRGLPTPMVSFMRLSGLYKVCPKARRCSKYYMGHIGEYQTAKVEVLTGAFMLLRRKVILRIGLLDEGYFMYGEDIDYSYRVLLGGYLNYYYPEVSIIHFKGESTRKSIRSVKAFYEAMALFADNYFIHNRFFYYMYKPVLYMLSKGAIFKTVVFGGLFKRGLFGSKSNITSKVYVLSANDELKDLVIKSQKSRHVVSKEISKRRNVSVFVDLSTISIKTFIEQIHTYKGRLFFMPSVVDFCVKVSSSKSFGKIVKF